MHLYFVIFFISSVTSNSLILKKTVSSDVSPIHVVSCIAAIGVINVLSGDLQTYFLMRELSGKTSKFIM